MAKKVIDSRIIHRLQLLKNEVEDTFGWKLDSYAAYRNTAVEIEERGNDKISTDTLINMWQKKLEHYPYPSKLNIIVRVLGYKDWESYCEIQDRNTTLHSFFDPAKYKVENLHVEDNITLGWFPQYYVTFKYLGECKFEILSCSKTFKRKAGDIIIAYGFGLRYNYNIPQDTVDDKGNNVLDIMGYPLFPSIIFRAGPMPDNYPEIESPGFYVLY